MDTKLTRMLEKRLPITAAHCAKLGWVVMGKAKNGHIKLQHPELGKAQVAFSTSCRRGDLTTRARLRRRESR